jgi:hypothetical protein
MGFHTCEYCAQKGNIRPATSSGDVTLKFRSNLAQTAFVMPDMIVHYVLEHDYLPPENFVNSVLLFELSDEEPTGNIDRVGYLTGNFQKNDESAGQRRMDAAKTLSFLRRLTYHIRKATSLGHRRQTRGFLGKVGG